MKHLKLDTNKTPKRRTSQQERGLKKNRIKNRAKNKQRNKQYYAKNKREILKQARKTSARKAKGDNRTTRLRTYSCEMARIRLAASVLDSVLSVRSLVSPPLALLKLLQARNTTDVVQWQFYSISKDKMYSPTLTLYVVKGRYHLAFRSDLLHRDTTGPLISSTVPEVQEFIEDFGQEILIEIKSLRGVK